MVAMGFLGVDLNLLADEILQRYLKLGVDVHDVVLLSSANEASLQ